ncbi:Predicted arabinose efflux permease, MFS family [Micromonospora sediminicola]|uniref:Predicted arabinose efflux permease, MFS family n=1 Tax=Micromonospora sediminicola TaxID=946078 RepID=A0A1A9BBV5_9ACTN|nr:MULTISPECIES: MFS transporter [Micromonospora]PGH44757.1 MFS transporter [Micromonospora sp. WMMA1996]SBT66561.1 Predicted arabinose efflux permease, MFS family [Micromonospora sediminicola]
MTGERLGGRFARLWTASTLSALGSGTATVAAPLYVASRTDDPLVVSAGAAVSWLPWLLFALPGGVLADRVDRRRLMVLIDWVRVVALVVLAAAMLTERAGVALLYVVLFVVNTGEVVFRTAAQAVLPAVVPRSRLERANGWLNGGTQVTQNMVAGPLGGFLFVLAAAAPFALNAGTYALSAVLVGLLAGTYRGEGKPTGPRSARAEIAEGFRWLLSQRLLRTMTMLIGLLNVTLTAALAVLVLLATERLGLGSVGYGALFTCMAVGGLLGSVVGDRLVAAITATWTVRVGLLTEAVLHLALAASRSAVVVGLALFAFGVHSALWNIVANSLRQRLTPTALMGRVGSTNLFIAAGGNCVGALLGGVVAARYGITAPYWVGFVVAVAVTAATWRVFDRAVVAAAYVDPAPEPSLPAAR